jgi:hypothetical protein
MNRPESNLIIIYLEGNRILTRDRRRSWWGTVVKTRLLTKTNITMSAIASLSDLFTLYKELDTADLTLYR